MAEEVPKSPQLLQVPQVEELVVVADVPQAEKLTAPSPPTMPLEEKEAPPVLDTEEDPIKPKQPLAEALETDNQLSKPSSGDVDDKSVESGSFKEESSRVSDLSDSEKKALQDLKHLVQEALNNHEFSFSSTAPPSVPSTKEEEYKNTVVDAEEEEEANKQPTEKEEKPQEPAKPETEADKEEKTELADTDEPKVATSGKSNYTADDDDAKTVEAIEETIVAVSSSSSPQEQTSFSAKQPDENVNVASCEPIKEVESEPPVVTPEEVCIWGIPLLADDRSDVILLKFLRARDFKVKDAFTMLKNTVRWRKEFGIDELVNQDLGDDLEKVVFMHGFDKEGHPVCYNVYGEFQDKELYQKTLSDEDKRKTFLRWRIQFLERSIRKLNFSPGGISTIVQVNDLKNSPGPTKRELRQVTSQALQLLQDNYPEFVAKQASIRWSHFIFSFSFSQMKSCLNHSFLISGFDGVVSFQVFINVPWWYLAVNRMISPFLTQRTRSKFVFAGPSKSAETLLRYIAAEQIPIKYGGLSKDGEFGTTDAVTEIIVKPAAKHIVEFPVTETCLLAWEVRVVGWGVSYGAEFVPSAEESYTVIIQKARKVGATEEPVVCNSFKIGEPGKVVLTIDNPTSKKKKLLYRLKTKPSSD